MSVILVTTTGAGNVVIPPHTGTVLVECWGAGQNGRDMNGYNGVDTDAANGSRGGHGGAYAQSVLALAAGTYASAIGAGGSAIDTSFNSGSVVAQAGQNGGIATGSTGTTKFSGGAGGLNTNTLGGTGGVGNSTGGLVASVDFGNGGEGDIGGGGGASGSSAGNGGDGQTSGGLGQQQGQDGQAPGGAGGGGDPGGDPFGGQSGTPGFGARGQIRITYTPIATNLTHIAQRTFQIPGVSIGDP